MRCAKFGSYWPSGSVEEFSLYIVNVYMYSLGICRRHLKFPLIKDALCQLWLKLAKWFWISYHISFERVHRIGKANEFNERPRNIVAKFSYFKDREYIRINAARKLHGTRIWVNEHFPPEIENNRKKLYPVMRQAKKDRKHWRIQRGAEGTFAPPPLKKREKEREKRKKGKGEERKEREGEGVIYLLSLIVEKLWCNLVDSMRNN